MCDVVEKKFTFAISSPDEFLLYNETLQQTSRPLLSKLSQRRQMSVIYPHFEEVRGGVEPWLMARWKARVEFLLSAIERLFTARAMLALQALY